MEYIYSKIEPTKLLHSVVRLSEIETQDSFRKDLVDADEFIQCSSLIMKKNHTFRPHKHNVRQRDWAVIAQESWIVIRGSVKCIFYDLDDQIIAEPILMPGDASFSFGYAGHNYLILEDDTVVYEAKTGKYEGQAIDKTFLS